MSHFTQGTLEIRDEAALVAALEELGFAGKVEVHLTPSTLYGYRGDARPERAHVIIRRQHVGRLSNDLGFRQEVDGRFTAIVSEYDRETYGPTWLTRLTDLAGVQRALRLAASRGQRAERRVDERGRHQVVITVR